MTSPSLPPPSSAIKTRRGSTNIVVPHEGIQRAPWVILTGAQRARWWVEAPIGPVIAAPAHPVGQRPLATIFDMQQQRRYLGVRGDVLPEDSHESRDDGWLEEVGLRADLAWIGAFARRRWLQHDCCARRRTKKRKGGRKSARKGGRG